MADRVGQQLGDYLLERFLGRGGFAEVYLGRHLRLGSLAAIKVLHAQLTLSDVEAFRAEALTIARLQHPHIIRLLAYDAEQGTPFLVMEYAPNGTLRERYARGKPLSLETVLEYVGQVGSALQYAHDQRLIHRDVKPENLLLGSKGQILLSDFGIALVAQSSHSQSTKEAVGTVAYMAPEQIQGHPRPASDQYALAVMTYEWLTGAQPFQGSFTEIATQQLFATPTPLRTHVPTILSEVEQVVMAALAKDPRQRFPNVAAFVQALEQASQGIAPVLFAPTQITPQEPINTATLTVPADRRPAGDTTRLYPTQMPPGSLPGTTAKAPENQPGANISRATFSSGNIPGGVPLSPGRAPGQTRPPARHIPAPRPLVKVLLVILALALIVMAGGALALSRGFRAANNPSSTLAHGPTSTPTGSLPTAPGASSTPNPGATATSTGSSAPTNTPVPGATNTSTPTPTNTPIPTPTNTPIPTPTTRLPSWQPWYTVSRPACDDTSAWQDVNHAATRDCSSSNGLVLSQYSNTLFAELDMDSPNGSSSAYNQTQFQVKVQAGFLNPSDTSVWAAIIVQTPKASNQYGGYILAVNSQGDWQLQKANSGAPTTLQSGQVGINVSNFTMQVTVQNGYLWAYINGQQVVNAFGDSLNPSPGVIGLMEQSAKATSSAILYNNFEFDLWG